MARRYSIPELTRLIGGYICVLSPEERNKWTEHIQGTPEAEDYMTDVARIEMLARRQQSTSVDLTDEMLALEKQETITRRVLFVIGKTWYEKLVAVEEKAIAES